jgi:RNA polymerase sigma factor (TIGR02999 family)
MSHPVPGDVTRVLRRIDAGEREALSELLPLVYDELRGLARGQMAGERDSHTLQPTALVHEAYVRLAGRKKASWENRGHFYRAAAAVMRSILVNHARDRKRMKRGGNCKKLPLDETVAVFEERAIDLVALDEALEKLAEVDPRKASVVELRFVGGLSVKDTAEALGVAPRTVEADWSLARAWLLGEIKRE